MGDAAGTERIADGKRYGEGSGARIEGGGIGAAGLLHFSAGHAPLVGASVSLASVDEAETVSCGQLVVKDVKGGNGSFTIFYCYFLGRSQCLAC